jgi:hypothetical protein
VGQHTAPTHGDGAQAATARPQSSSDDVVEVLRAQMAEMKRELELLRAGAYASGAAAAAATPAPAMRKRKDGLEQYPLELRDDGDEEAEDNGAGRGNISDEDNGVEDAAAGPAAAAAHPAAAAAPPAAAAAVAVGTTERPIARAGRKKSATRIARENGMAIAGSMWDCLKKESAARLKMPEDALLTGPFSSLPQNIRGVILEVARENVRMYLCVVSHFFIIYYYYYFFNVAVSFLIPPNSVRPDAGGRSVPGDGSQRAHESGVQRAQPHRRGHPPQPQTHVCPWQEPGIVCCSRHVHAFRPVTKLFRTGISGPDPRCCQGP